MHLEVITQDGFMFPGQNRWIHIASFRDDESGAIYVLICDTFTQRKYVHELVGDKLKAEVPPEEVISEVEKWMDETYVVLPRMGEVPLSRCLFTSQRDANLLGEITKIEEELAGEREDNREFMKGFWDGKQGNKYNPSSSDYAEGYRAGYVARLKMMNMRLM